MTFREIIRSVTIVAVTWMACSAVCVYFDWNMFGGVHGKFRDTTYSFDTTSISIPETESKDIAAQPIDSAVKAEVIWRWRYLGYDTTFITLRDTIIKRIERDPFSLVLAFSDSLRWRNNLTVVLPQSTEQIKDSGYVYVHGYADFLQGIVHIDPIRISPFKAVTINKTETLTKEKSDQLSLSIYGERDLFGPDTSQWRFGARARYHLGPLCFYITGDVDGNTNMYSKAGVELKVLSR